MAGYMGRYMRVDGWVWLEVVLDIIIFYHFGMGIYYL
jgi:hypothetical protein